jgi:hypothetical protein
MAVHYIDVDGGAAAALGSGYLVGQVGKIRGKDGWEKLDHNRLYTALKGHDLSRAENATTKSAGFSP